MIYDSLCLFFVNCVLRPTRCLNQDAERSNSPTISDLPGISTHWKKHRDLNTLYMAFKFLWSCTMMARRPYKTTASSLDLGRRVAFGGSRVSESRVYHRVHQTKGYVVHRPSSSLPVKLTREFSCNYRPSAYRVVPPTYPPPIPTWTLLPLGHFVIDCYAMSKMANTALEF